MSTYRAKVTRDGKWWMIAIPDIDGLTQARRLSEVPTMASEYIAAATGEELDSFALMIEFDTVGAVEGINQTLEKIRKDRELAATLQREATALAEHLAKDLASQGVPLRDVGAILEVSHQRAQQLVKA
jgi:hypothetical protein